MATGAHPLHLAGRLAAALIVCLLVYPLPAHAECDSSNPEEVTNDCDDDGQTVGDGDCDDGDPDISPDVEEVCADEIDNNCDGEADEGCGELPEGAVLSGGGQCSIGLGLGTGASSIWVMVVLGLRRSETCS